MALKRAPGVFLAAFVHSEAATCTTVAAMSRSALIDELITRKSLKDVIEAYETKADDYDPVRHYFRPRLRITLHEIIHLAML